PPWIRDVRHELDHSPAWEVLSDNLYERVEVILDAHGLGHFSDLRPAEQVILLEEAQRKMVSDGNKVYHAFEAQFSKIMDAKIAKEARRARLLEDNENKADGADEALYLERIIETAAEGAVCLLRELPREHAGSLRLMLNRSIPSRSRLDIWKLLLSHSTAKEEYTIITKQNANLTISGQDVQITHRCQALLETNRMTQTRVLPISSRNVILMKTVLSYHHACKMPQKQQGQRQADAVTIPDSYIHFIIPLCVVMETTPAVGGGGAPIPNPNQGKPPERQMGRVIVELVGMFEAALEAGLGSLATPRVGVGDERGSSHPPTGSGTPTRQIPRAGGTTRKAREVVREDSVSPPWVETAFQALMGGLPALLAHIGEVYSGALKEEHLHSRRRGGTRESPGGRDHSNHAGAGRRGSTRGDAGEEDAEDGSRKDERDDTRRLGEPGDGSEVGSDDGGRYSDTSTRNGHEDEPGGRKEAKADTGAHEEGEEGRQSKEGKEGKEKFPQAQDPPLLDPKAAKEGLRSLLMPLVSVALVGHLSKDSLVFVWDQAVMGGFHAIIPRFAAMVLASVEQELLLCSTMVRMSNVVHDHSLIITVSQLQELMEKHCMSTLRKELEVGEKLAPVLVGPDLETATQIMEQTYSIHTRDLQQ
ncbi:unnamed protein product, partial [Discosporangium mesarthrocarpum]